jgi:hypothetical protein
MLQSISNRSLDFFNISRHARVFTNVSNHATGISSSPRHPPRDMSEGDKDRVDGVKQRPIKVTFQANPKPLIWDAVVIASAGARAHLRSLNFAARPIQKEKVVFAPLDT